MTWILRVVLAADHASTRHRDGELCDEESYTSKASLLDLEEIAVYHPNHEEKHVFSGKHIGPRQRLHRTKDGHKICADVNGAYTITETPIPDASSDAKGVVGYVVHLGWVIVPA